MISLPSITGNKKQESYSTLALAAVAAFTTYFCMYGFRKTFSAATFDGQQAFGISFKSALIIAQVLGYMISKFIGIRFIAEINKSGRARYILLLILGAHCCLLGLAIVPMPYNVIFLFLNGLCLGLIWGLVFSFIEGRNYTDFIALVLSANFIFSSGAVKTIGRTTIEQLGVPEIFMPFVSGCMFLPLLFLSVHWLRLIPPPAEHETAERGKRPGMNKEERWRLVRQFLPGLSAIVVMNLLLTILRDIKDNYSVEMIRQVQPAASFLIYTKMETVASVVVLVILIGLAGMKDHFKALGRQHLVIGTGFITILVTAVYLIDGTNNLVTLLVVYTIGLYLCYNTLQCLFLERFISAFRVNGNIGFLFYLMDSIGYLGSCYLILHKELFDTETNWLTYFTGISLVFALAGILATMLSWAYLKKKFRTTKQKDRFTYVNITL